MDNKSFIIIIWGFIEIRVVCITAPQIFLAIVWENIRIALQNWCVERTLTFVFSK